MVYNSPYSKDESMTKGINVGQELIDQLQTKYKTFENKSGIFRNK